MPKLSLIFSFRNEQETIPELLRRTRLTLSDIINKNIISNYELIFVNDASTDNSLHILIDQSKNFNDIRVITMSRSFGVSPCVLAGMEFATGDIVIYMDADLQDPPELIPKLIETWRNEANIDVVHTVRLSRKGESKIKLWITRLGYWILNKLSSIQIPVESGDFKLLSRRVVNHLIRLREQQPFLRGLVCWVGFNQRFLNYHREPRFAGKSKFNILGRKVFSNFFSSALISFSSIPLKIASFFGLFALLFDFVLMIHVLLEKFEGKAIPGWTAIMIAVLFMGGVQLFCVGIIGLYLHSVHEQSKNRPNYIIESTYGFSNDGKQSSQSTKPSNAAEKFLA